MLTSFARTVTSAMVSAACNCRVGALKGSAGDVAMDSIAREGGTHSITGAGGSDDSKHGVSVQARACDASNWWQNTWEQAPGVPATPSPP